MTREAQKRQGSRETAARTRRLTSIVQRLAIAAMAAAMPLLAAAQSPFVPNFWDPSERFVRPDINALPRIRFLTTTDFPPFNFIDRRKRLTGFHVDLAREICEVLEVMARCQIQALPWDELEGALEKGDGEAIIAGIEITAENRDRLAFSRPYLRVPGRFITRNADALGEPLYENLFRKTVGVVSGSAHEAYFAASFGERRSQGFATRQMAFNALKQGQVDAVFTDAVSASFWLASTDAAGCCDFAGGPYISERHFGHGMAIAARKENAVLVAAFDYALKSINDSGKFRELYLRYFPLGLY